MSKKAKNTSMLVVLSIFGFFQLAQADEVSELKKQMKMTNSQMGKKINARSDKLKIKGSLWEYYLHQDNSYFAGTSSSFLETTARIGLEAALNERILADIQLMAQNSQGDAKDYLGLTEHDVDFGLELANITLKEFFESPVTLTVGRQNLEFGDGFLIYDGYADVKAIWTGARRSFDAIKAVYAFDGGQLDVFGALVNDDYISYESYLTDFTARTGDRVLSGASLHIENKQFGTWDFGVFYRDDDSDLASDTAAFSQRGSYTFDFWPDTKILPQVIFEGEVVEQVGHTRMQNHMLTGDTVDRETLGGHIDARFSFSNITFSPYLQTSYIYLPGDDPDTSANEAFDPFFYGFKDWGKWYIGSINSYNLFNYNQRTVQGELGFYPTETTSVRMQYFYTDLDREITADAGREWSHEINLVFDYYPNERFFAGIEFGWVQPLKAAEAYAGDDKETTEVVIYSGIQF